MGAAFLLRMTEARRRGAPLLLLAAVVLVLVVARRAGETVDGRYGLATDLAAALAYLGAVVLGTFPLASDRERKRATLPAASPVPPWVWALGNAGAAAAQAGAAALLLFAAAGLGAWIDGGTETNAVAPLNAHGTLAVPAKGLPPISVPEGTRAMRLVARAVLRDENPIGSPDLPRLEVNGEVVPVVPGRPIVVPVEGPKVVIRNATPAFAIGLVSEEVRAIEEPRPFLLNACAAGVAPALGAAALAALGAAAGANLSAPVAALLLTLILGLSSMKGFLLDTFRYGGSAVAAQEQRTESGGAPGHGHAHGPATPELAPSDSVRDAARAGMRVVLMALPSLGSLDRTGRVAVGEWTGLGRAGYALALLCAGLAAGAVLGGIGVHRRRLP